MVIKVNSEITIQQLRPFIRYAHRICITSRSYFCNQKAYDHRLFYVLQGHGRIRIGENIYTMPQQSLLMWKSGMEYDLLCDLDESFVLLGLNFDYTYEHCRLSVPIEPSKDNFRSDDVLEHLNFTDIELLNHPIYIKSIPDIEEELTTILDEYKQSRILSSVKMCGTFLSALTVIIRSATLTTTSTKHNQKQSTEILHYIHQHYFENIDNHTLGKMFNYHPNYINHLIILQTGLSLHQYVLRYRINRAMDYLKNSDLPVYQIAELVGFKDYNHFLKYFKQITGYTTSNFR